MLTASITAEYSKYVKYSTIQQNAMQFIIYCTVLYSFQKTTNVSHKQLCRQFYSKLIFVKIDEQADSDIKIMSFQLLFKKNYEQFLRTKIEFHLCTWNKTMPGWVPHSLTMPGWVPHSLIGGGQCMIDNHFTTFRAFNTGRLSLLTHIQICKDVNRA